MVNFDDDENALRDFGDALKPTPITTKGISNISSFSTVFVNDFICASYFVIVVVICITNFHLSHHSLKTLSFHFFAKSSYSVITVIKDFVLSKYSSSSLVAEPHR